MCVENFLEKWHQPFRGPKLAVSADWASSQLAEGRRAADGDAPRGETKEEGGGKRRRWSRRRGRASGEHVAVTTSKVDDSGEH